MNNLDKSRSHSTSITLEGDTITIGERKFPIQQIEYVEVAFHPPRRYLLLVAISFALFFLIGISMFGIGLISIFLGKADSPIVAWILGLIFIIGGPAYFGIFIFAMIAYPVEWRVDVATREGIVTVQTERSRARAVTFASRIKRLCRVPTKGMPLGL